MNSRWKQRRVRLLRRHLRLESLETRSLLAADFMPLQNVLDPEDVDDDGQVTPVDALICINQLNSDQPPDAAARLFHDVNGDRSMSPLDALLVINRLNDPNDLNHDSGPRPTPEPNAIPIASIDGTGHNLAHPDWGSVGVDLLRTTPVAYADGVATPAGADRPSARVISNALAAETDEPLNDRHLTAMTYAWGQFLDHDIDLTPSATPKESFNIAVPAGDPEFDPTNTGTQIILLRRSQFDPATGTDATNPRQQVNTITAFIDGSQIYGSDATRAAALRTFIGGQLKSDDNNLLPVNDAGLPNANDAHRVADDQLFLAGDVRANENVELTSLHALFVREHNRLAAEIAARDPQLSDEQVFQRARVMVVAELQTITYNEFLPALLGFDALQPYTGYKPNVNPGIANEFSTAAFRVGHTLLGNDVEFLDMNGEPIRDEVALRDAFFNPDLLRETGIDSILNYLVTTKAHEIDTQVVDEVRNFLFGPPGAGGFDLASLNIQRGRDHGLADYNSTRAAYGLPRVQSFEEITSNPELQTNLRDLYGSVDNIDLWVGGLAEDNVLGSSVGPTFRRIIADQFERLRDGDRFWFQNILRSEALRQAENTTLADVVRRNTSATNMQYHVFFDPSVMIHQARDRQPLNIVVVGGDGTVQIVEHRDPPPVTPPGPGPKSNQPPPPLPTQNDRVLASRPADEVSQVMVLGTDFRPDRVLVDYSRGELPMADGIVVQGGAGPGDVLIVRGTSGVDTIVVEPGRISVNGHQIQFAGIEEIRIQTGPGDDIVTITEQPGVRVIVDRDPHAPPPAPGGNPNPPPPPGPQPGGPPPAPPGRDNRASSSAGQSALPNSPPPNAPNHQSSTRRSHSSSNRHQPLASGGLNPNAVDALFSI